MGRGAYPTLLFMARIDKALVAKARDRLKKVIFDEESYMDNRNYAPPHARGDTPELIDADGYRYLNLEGLRERGDLVAGFDPDAPTAAQTDLDQILLNRELELAREKAEAEEAARLEAEARALADEAARVEAERVATANAQNLEATQKAMEDQAAEYEKKLAEMQAKLDAMAKEKAGDAVQEHTGSATAKVKKAAPKRKAVKKASQEDLSDFE